MKKPLAKIVGVMMSLFMATGIAVAVNNKGAMPVRAAETTYTDRTFSFASNSLASGLSTNGTWVSSGSYYKMFAGNKAEITSAAFIGEGKVLSSSTLTANVKIATYGTWTNPKTANVTIAFYNSNNVAISTSAATTTKTIESNSPSYDYSNTITVNAPADPSSISYLRITFSALSETTSGSLRFTEVKMTYKTNTVGGGGSSSAAPATYSVTYNANNGTGTMIDNTSYTSGSNVTVLANRFTRTGYYFAGFNTAANGLGTSYNPGARFAISANTTLFAQWSAKPSAISNTITDTFTQSDITATGNSYATFSAVGATGATYVGYSMRPSSAPNIGCIQFNTYSSSKNRSIATSASGGYIRRVSVEWGNANSQSFTVYVGDSAYSNSSTGASGTSKGTINASTTYLNITGGDYKFVSLYANGAVYPLSVSFVWEPLDQTLTTSSDSAYVDQTISVSSNATSAVTWSVVNDGDTTAAGAAVTSGGVVSVSGAGTVKVKAVALGYKDATRILTFAERPADPFISPEKNSTSGYTGQNETISFTYGNLTGLLSVESDDEDVVKLSNFSASAGTGSVKLNFVGDGDTEVKFYNGDDSIATIEVSVDVSEVTITGLASSNEVFLGKTLNLGSTVTVTACGIYSDDVTWESDDDDIVSVNENGVITGVAIGTANVSVTSDDYPSATMSCAVTVSYADYKLRVASSISIGDIVYLASDAGAKQFDEISTTSTKYGLGIDYDGEPNKNAGVALEVCEGNSEGTYSLKLKSGDNADKYLYWGSENSLNVSSDVSNNSSWTISFDGNNVTIKNVADDSRVIWWNNTYPRFACYSGVSEGSTYKYVQLWKLTTPDYYLKSTTPVTTIQGNIIRFGSTISQEAWNSINSDWPITNYGVMIYKTDSLQGLPENPVETAFRAGVVLPKIIAKGSGVAPSPVDGNYTFTARVSVENNDTIFCAASFIVAGGRYYFFNEVQKSADSLL